MSRLLKHIQMRKTTERVLEPLKMVTVEHTTLDHPIDYGYIYRVKATLGAELVVSETAIQSMTDEMLKEYLRSQVYRPLAEEVFGEYRKPLIDAIFAIHKREPDKAVELIDSVLDSMFKVE